VRFPRAVVTRLEDLTAEDLQSALGGWLSPKEIESLLLRRDDMLERVRSLVYRVGADSVLYR